MLRGHVDVRSETARETYTTTLSCRCVNFQQSVSLPLHPLPQWASIAIAGARNNTCIWRQLAVMCGDPSLFLAGDVPI